MRNPTGGSRGTGRTTWLVTLFAVITACTGVADEAAPAADAGREGHDATLGGADDDRGALDAAALNATARDAADGAGEGDGSPAASDGARPPDAAGPDAPGAVSDAAPPRPDALVPELDAGPPADAGPLTYRNIVLDESGDPGCRQFGDAYYAYLPKQVRRDGVGIGGRVVAFRSTDLVHWDELGEVFNNIDEAYGGRETVGLWAPEVLFHEGRYYLYYVNVMSDAADPDVGDKDILVIASDDPADFRGGGRRTVLLDNDHAFIDPSPFEDPVTHELYLVFKRRGPVGTGTEIDIRPMSSPTAFSGRATVLLESEDVPDSLQIIEHPALWREGGVFYLLFSRGQGDNTSYAIAYATAPAALGPYTQRGVLFRSSADLDGDLSRKVIAPGASSIVRDGAGRPWMVYRQKKTTEVTFGDRGLCIDPIEIHPGERRIEGRATKGVERPGPTPL